MIRELAPDRITPYKQGGSIEERIDEIFIGKPAMGCHFEMMSGNCAWLRVGTEIFWINAVKGKLVCSHGETRPDYAEPSDAPTSSPSEHPRGDGSPHG